MADPVPVTAYLAPGYTNEPPTAPPLPTTAPEPEMAPPIQIVYESSPWQKRLSIISDYIQEITQGDYDAQQAWNTRGVVLNPFRDSQGNLLYALHPLKPRWGTPQQWAASINDYIAAYSAPSETSWEEAVYNSGFRFPTVAYHVEELGPPPTYQRPPRPPPPGVGQKPRKPDKENKVLLAYDPMSSVYYTAPIAQNANVVGDVRADNIRSYQVFGSGTGQETVANPQWLNSVLLEPNAVQKATVFGDLTLQIKKPGQSSSSGEIQRVPSAGIPNTSALTDPVIEFPLRPSFTIFGFLRATNTQNRPEDTSYRRSTKSSSMRKYRF